MNGESPIATYNMMGGSLEGFAIPTGLLKMMGSQQQTGGSSLISVTLPDVTNVTAIPKGLYEKLMDLAKYSNASKKQTKGRNRKGGNKKTRKI
jgi:hypothetical protein